MGLSGSTKDRAERRCECDRHWYLFVLAGFGLGAIVLRLFEGGMSP